VRGSYRPIAAAGRVRAERQLKPQSGHFGIANIDLLYLSDQPLLDTLLQKLLQRKTHMSLVTSDQQYFIRILQTIITVTILTASYSSQADELPKHPVTINAVASANKLLIKQALAGQIPINKQDEAGATALVHAATLGDGSAVKKLIKMGIDINKRKKNGGTALIAAAQTGRDLIVIDLIKAGADIETTALNGRINALVQTITFNYPKTMKVLLEHGAKPNPISKTVIKPLYNSINLPSINLNTVKTLIKFGADVNAKSLGQNDHLYPIIYQALGTKRFEAVKLLLKHGADPDTRMSDGSNLISLAIENRNHSILKILLNAGANPNTILPKNGWPSLPFVISHKDLKSAVYLLNAGADPNVETPDKFTSIGRAILNNDHKAVILLSKYKADLNLGQGGGMRYPPLIMVGAGLSTQYAYHSAKYNNDYDNYFVMVDLLLSLGADPNVQDGIGNTLLSYAGGEHSRVNNNIVQLLLSYGASWDKKNIANSTAYESYAYNKKKNDETYLKQVVEAEREKNGFNWGKALTMSAGFLAGGGGKLNVSDQLEAVIGIVRDSQAGVSGVSNTTGALKNATQRYQSENTSAASFTQHKKAGVTKKASIHTYAICKKRVNDMAFEAGCLAVYKVGNKSCSDKSGTTCSTNIESLCNSSGYSLFASGQGTFSSPSNCRTTCDQQYGGKFAQFGGVCNEPINY